MVSFTKTPKTFDGEGEHKFLITLYWNPIRFNRESLLKIKLLGLSFILNYINLQLHKDGNRFL